MRVTKVEKDQSESVKKIEQLLDLSKPACSTAEAGV
jgi:hypothetical protein